MTYIIHETTEDSEYLYHNPGVSGRIILSRDPINPSEAVTKKYVDDSDALHNLNIRHLNPDEKTFLDNLSLSSEEFGYVANLTENPQTLINKKINKSGVVITGEIISEASPTNDLDCVTKELCDSLDVVFPSNVGDIYQTTNVTPPPHHLVCDGSLKSKTTYSNLFNIIGDLYETKTLNVTTIPFQIVVERPSKQTLTANKLVFSEVPTNTDTTLFRLPNIPPYVKNGVTVYNYIRY